MTQATMKDDVLPQIQLVRDTDLGVFTYGMHILAGDFLRESEFNLRSLTTNTGPNSIAIIRSCSICCVSVPMTSTAAGSQYMCGA